MISYIYIKYQITLGNYSLNLEDPFNEAGNFKLLNCHCLIFFINLTEGVVWALQARLTVLTRPHEST